MEQYDAIVIGSGQAGTPLSIALAEAGRKTGFIERGNVGGTCINVGCTPTKTMVASARIAFLARRAAEYGVRCGGVGADKLPYTALEDGVFAHPGWAEGLNTLFMNMEK